MCRIQQMKYLFSHKSSLDSTNSMILNGSKIQQFLLIWFRKWNIMFHLVKPSGFQDIIILFELFEWEKLSRIWNILCLQICCFINVLWIFQQIIPTLPMKSFRTVCCMKRIIHQYILKLNTNVDGMILEKHKIKNKYWINRETQTIRKFSAASWAVVRIDWAQNNFECTICYNRF